MPTEELTDARLAALDQDVTMGSGQHYPVCRDGYRHECKTCDDAWPCIAGRLLLAYPALRAALDTAVQQRDALQAKANTYFGVIRRGDEERDALRAEVDTLNETIAAQDRAAREWEQRNITLAGEVATLKAALRDMIDEARACNDHNRERVAKASAALGGGD